MNANRLHPKDCVSVEIYYDGGLVETYRGSGFHDIADAISAACANSVRMVKPSEDYVFRVTDANNASSARYRINAGGHVRILPE